MFGSSEESRSYWASIITELMFEMYPHSVTVSPSVSLKDQLIGSTPLYLAGQPNTEGSKRANGLSLLFKEFVELFGISFRGKSFHFHLFHTHTLIGNLLQAFTFDPSLFNVTHPFGIVDIVSLEEKVKRTQIIAHSQGTVLRMQVVSIYSVPNSFSRVLLS